MRPLHRMNPARVGWIEERIARALRPSATAAVLDVGCGAGLAAEALARRGHDVLGPGRRRRRRSRRRGPMPRGQDLPLAYRDGRRRGPAGRGAALPGDHRAGGDRARARSGGLPGTLAGLLEPGGRLFLSTLNRTPRRSWPPRSAPNTCCAGCRSARMTGAGSSRRPNWARMLRRAGLRVADIAGLVRDPLTGRWQPAAIFRSTTCLRHARSGWCPGEDSNFHDLAATGTLKPARLPIPPPGQGQGADVTPGDRRVNGCHGLSGPPATATAPSGVSSTSRIFPAMWRG